jgi:hypothetical protein
VRWGLKDLLDYAVDAATVDVRTRTEGSIGQRAWQYVYAVSARNDRIAERMKLFHAAKFPLEAIDVPEMAQRNVAQLFEQQARGLALLAFDDLGGLLTFTAGGELYMARRTEITAAQLTEVKGEAREQTLDRLVLELQRSLDHFDRQFSYVGVSRMLVAPLAVDLGLERYLADNLGVPVETLDLSQVLELTGAPELRDPTRQGIGCTSSARHCGRSSPRESADQSLQPGTAPKPDFFSGSTILITLSTLCIALLLVYGVTAYLASRASEREQLSSGRLTQLQAEITRLSQEVSARKPSAQLNAELESLDALLAARNEVIGVLKSGVLGDTKGVSEYFRAFARQSIDGLWLTGFTVVGAGNDISIEGRTLRAELVPIYIQRLRREDSLRGHGFATLSVQPPTEVTLNGETRRAGDFLEFHMASRAPDAQGARAQARR